MLIRAYSNESVSSRCSNVRNQIGYEEVSASNLRITLALEINHKVSVNNVIIKDPQDKQQIIIINFDIATLINGMPFHVTTIITSKQISEKERQEEIKSSNKMLINK